MDNQVVNIKPKCVVVVIDPKLIELRSQIKKAKAKAEQADKAAKEKAAKDAADQKLADEMKATQEAADKRPQNGNGAASIPPK